MSRLTHACNNHPWMTLTIWFLAVCAAVLLFSMSQESLVPSVVSPPSDPGANWLAYRPPPDHRSLACASGQQVGIWTLGSVPGPDMDARQATNLATRIAECYAAKWQLPVASSSSPRFLAPDASGLTYLDALPLMSPALLANWADIQNAQYSDQDIARIIREDIVRAERITLPLTLLILLVVFRNPLLALFPLLIGCVTCLVSIGILTSLAPHLTISVFVVTIATMLGLALGIDYSLFWLKSINSEDETLADDRRVTTILAAGFTIACSCVGLILVPLGIFRVIVLGVILVVVTAVLASITLLPSLLRVIPGRWLTRIPVPVSFPRQIRKPRISFNLPLALIPTAILVLLCLQAPSIRTGLSADPIAGPVSSNPIGKESYQQYAREELITAQLSTLEIMVARSDEDSATARVLSYIGQHADTAPVVMLESYPDSGIEVLRLIVVRPPDSSASSALVSDLRAQIDAKTFTPYGGIIALGGPLAMYKLVDGAIEERQILSALTTLALMAIVIFVLFRSLLSALLAVTGSLVTFAAALGALELLTRDTIPWITVPGPAPYVESWIPIVMFSVIMGTSIDYFIFIISGISPDSSANPESIRLAIHKAAPVVVTAALIMVIVFAGFSFGDVSAIRQLGAGLAICMFIDAFLIRLYLLPVAAHVAIRSGLRLVNVSGWFKSNAIH